MGLTRVDFYFPSLSLLKGMKMTNKRIALIGGAGFVGHHLALSLRQAGQEVHIIDGLGVNNLLSFASNSGLDPTREFYWDVLKDRLRQINQQEIPLYVEDARNYDRLHDILSQIEPSVIVALAAVSHANQSNTAPYKAFDHSLHTLENALDYAKVQGDCHFIYFSSSMVYGDFGLEAVSEDTECRPLGIYAALKFAGEKLVESYHQVFDVPYTIVRPSALYGERCVSRRVGQVFLESAIQGREIVIYGSGLERLDFTYINDLVSGIRQVIEHPNSRNQTFNLTYGDSRSIGDLVKIVKENFPALKVRNEPGDRLMPKRGTLSIEKAKQLIDYTPQYPLEKGFANYIAWYRKFWEQAWPV